jgi:hypothetical protein
MPRLVAIVVVVLLIAGCSAAGVSPSPSVSPSPEPSASPSPEPSVSSRPDLGSSSAPASPTPASAAPTFPSPSPATSNPVSSGSPSLVTPAPSAPDAEFAVPSLVATVVADVRVRSEPGLAASSQKLTPLLPIGTELAVLSGPVAADGYHWYEITPLVSRGVLPSGWVAASSRSGEPWLTARSPECPAIPTTFAALAALPPALGLVCFPRTPITVEARIVPCDCDIDGDWFDPSWFTDVSGGNLLIDPARTTADPHVRMFWLYLDAAARRPETLPSGHVVTVTGMFDHPAAEDCVRHPYYPESALPTGSCRLNWAVTEIVQ